MVSHRMVKEDNLNKNIKNIIYNLQTGEFSKPIRTSSGFMIIKIEDKKEYQTKFNLNDKLKKLSDTKETNNLINFLACI